MDYSILIGTPAHTGKDKNYIVSKCVDINESLVLMELKSITKNDTEPEIISKAVSKHDLNEWIRLNRPIRKNTKNYG